eukprot:SAG11_NODE_862_length_6840_cov_35.328586_3_plen_626_part_00
MKLIFLFLLPLALGMEPEPETVSVDDVQILKLIKQQFDIKLADKEAEIRRLTQRTNILARPIEMIAGFDGGYWDMCREGVEQEFSDELEQAGIDDIDCVSLSTLRRYVPDIEGSVYYQLRAAYEHLTHGGGQASNVDLERWGPQTDAARKIQAVARGRAVRRTMKMDDEAAEPEPAAEPETAPDDPAAHIAHWNSILDGADELYSSNQMTDTEFSEISARAQRQINYAEDLINQHNAEWEATIAADSEPEPQAETETVLWDGRRQTVMYNIIFTHQDGQISQQAIPAIPVDEMTRVADNLMILFHGRARCVNWRVETMGGARVWSMSQAAGRAEPEPEAEPDDAAAAEGTSDHCFNCGNNYNLEDNIWTHACYGGCGLRVCDNCLPLEVQDNFDESLVFCTNCAPAAAVEAARVAIIPALTDILRAHYLRAANGRWIYGTPSELAGGLVMMRFPELRAQEHLQWVNARANEIVEAWEEEDQEDIPAEPEPEPQDQVRGSGGQWAVDVVDDGHNHYEAFEGRDMTEGEARAFFQELRQRQDLPAGARVESIEELAEFNPDLQDSDHTMSMMSTRCPPPNRSPRQSPPVEVVVLYLMICVMELKKMVTAATTVIGKKKDIAAVTLPN